MHQLASPWNYLFLVQAVPFIWTAVTGQRTPLENQHKYAMEMALILTLISHLPRITTYAMVVDTVVVLLCMQFARF